MYILIKILDGKTMERVMGKKNTKIITLENSKLVDKYFRQGEVLNYQLMNENLVLLDLKKKTIILDKPIYTGAAILDLSKCHIYDMIYNVSI
jgi:hypothetical protein